MLVESSQPGPLELDYSRRAVSAQCPAERRGIVHRHAIHGEWLRQQGPIPVDEAQRPAHPHIVFLQHVAHSIDLTVHSGDELRLVPPSNEQLGRTRPHEPGLPPFNPPLVLLGVNHPHPGRCNHEMVDVRPRRGRVRSCNTDRLERLSSIAPAASRPLLLWTRRLSSWVRRLWPG